MFVRSGSKNGSTGIACLLGLGDGRFILGSRQMRSARRNASARSSGTPPERMVW
jgi:hypothetical protein